MSAMVEVWVGELTKLREKVLAPKALLSKAKAKAKEGSEVELQAGLEKEAQKKDSVAVQRDTATMSEATVCLLMDRFVPW